MTEEFEWQDRKVCEDLISYRLYGRRLCLAQFFSHSEKIIEVYFWNSEIERFERERNDSLEDKTAEEVKQYVELMLRIRGEL